MVINMKKTFFNFSISLFSTIILGIVCSLVLAILKNNNSISNNVATFCINFLSIIIFFVLGFMFSFMQKKKGLLNGLILIVLYLIIYFICKSFIETNTPIYLTISRNLAILLGSVFGVNISSKNAQTN